MASVSLQPLLVLLAAAALLVALLANWRLPSALAYLTLGAVLGPHALGWLPENTTTEVLAELGVVFLMFMVGLEFSLPTLLAARRTIFGLGGLEVAMIGALSAGIAMAIGLSFSAAVIVGTALAMSSTAIVLKQLRDRGELNTQHGRLTVAVLIFQDLVTLPLLAVVPVLASDQGSWPVLQALASTAVAFIGLALLGRWLIRPFISWVAAVRSTELFMLAALLTVVGAAAVAQWVGLSAPLGAFLAGLVLGETQYRHQIEADVQPFQAVMLGLFFASIGMLLEPALLLNHWPEIVALIAGLVIMKAAAITALVRVAGQERRIAWRSGVILGHGGEFGLLLVSLALSHAMLPAITAQIVLAAIIGSMFIAPLLIHFNADIAQALTPGYRPREPAEVEAAANALDAHVILCGFDRTGQNLAQLLRSSGHAYLALDLDPARVGAAQQAEIPVVYGDATRRAVLAAAGTERACALVITLDEAHIAERIIDAARTINPELPILVRSRDDSHYEALITAGATEVLPEEFEASLMLGGQLLTSLGATDATITVTLAAMRAEQYQKLRRFYHRSNEKWPGKGVGDK